MGSIHTKLRSLLGPQKVLDTAKLKMDIRQRHVEAGTLRARPKRKIGRDDEPAENPSETSSDMDLSGAVLTPRALADALADDARLDDLDLDPLGSSVAATPAASSGQAEPVAPSAPRVHFYFGTQKLITLKDLFDYSKTKTTASSVGLDIFWKAAEANLAREMEYYELLAEDIGASGPSSTDAEARSDAQPTGNASNSPIIVD